MRTLRVYSCNNFPIYSMKCVPCVCTNCVYDCLRPHALQPARLLCPRGFPREFSMGVGCHFPSSGSSQPRGWTHVSCVFCNGRQILCHWVIWEAHILQQLAIIMSYLVSPVLVYLIIGSLYLSPPSFNPLSHSFYYCQHLVTTSLIYSSANFCLKFHIHVNKIIWYFSFSAWLVSLGIMSLRFICVTNGFLVFMTEWNFTIYNFFINSFIDGYLGCFPV